MSIAQPKAPEGRYLSDLGLGDSTRILARRGQTVRIGEWLGDKNVLLPPPSLLILYPTYECTMPGPSDSDQRLCPNCIFAGMLGPVHVDLGLIRTVIKETVAMGVRHLELSGGGEPLRYRHLPELLSSLIEAKTAAPDLKLGLLTNGLFLTPDLAARLVPWFTYVRASFAEGYLGEPRLKDLFARNLKSLLAAAQSTPGLRVGIKLLLNHRNAGYLAAEVSGLARDLGHRAFARLNHLRIKAMRSPDPRQEPTQDDRTSFLHELQDLNARGQLRLPDDTQVDLDLGYVASDFHCALTPLMGVVSPHGELMACYNYAEAHESSRIGNLAEQDLPQLWGSEHHREVVMGLAPDRICNSRHGCPCRFVQYQKVLAVSPPDVVPQLPPEVSALL
jgi:hypothetical protein